MASGLGLHRALGVVAAAVLLIAAGCGSAGGAGGSTGASSTANAGSGGGGGGGAAAPTKLPDGLTLGCAEDPSNTNCAYGGLASAPSGVQVFKVGDKITADKFKLTDPMTLTKDPKAPGGVGSVSTTTAKQGNAIMAVNIPSDGFYQVWAAAWGKQDATVDENSFFFSPTADAPTDDNDHTWDLNVDGAWHTHDTAGGCVQIRHGNPADQPDHCDAWHFKKGIVVLNFGGREVGSDGQGSKLAYVQVEAAKK